jgi:hydroxymethylpyrimidine/phosphomethylpyrimidine kinase
VVNILFDGQRFTTWRSARIESRSTHGTGCTLSAAVAACLALGHPLRDAVDAALDWVHRAIQAAPGLGAGHGPLNHFIAPRPPATSAGD